MIWQILAIVVLGLLVIYALIAKKSSDVPSSVFLITLFGVIVGLSMGALISLPLARIAGPLGQWLPIVANVFSVAVVTTFFYNQREQVTRSLEQVFDLVQSLVREVKRARRSNIMLGKVSGGGVALDTSAIIDGRVLDLCRTGFLTGRLLVPRFVLDELQAIADSDESLRRGKGRRGLEVLHEIKRIKSIRVEVMDEDFVNEPDVDSKIIKFAKKHQAKLMTVDYNLNRVAQIQNVPVLNVNELSNVLRPAVLPGEMMAVRIVQTGKDVGQGVGYLEDGTMIVVEGAGNKVGQELTVTVTRVFQTVAGKMIFAALEEAKVAG
jgi:uncharacterized protein YacL